MSEQRRRWVRSGAVAVVAALLVAACTAGEQASSGGDDKAGGDADPVVLTMANIGAELEQEPALQYFVDQVEQLSGGAVHIVVRNAWGHFALDVEQQMVRAVAAGELDLAWIGARAFDTLGVNSFRALTAPMLIDSYPLQKAVIASDIPGEMLAELDQLDITGIALLADALRKPIAVDQPLLSPADYDGLTFTALRSATLADSISALGAIPGEAMANSRKLGLSSGDIQGFEQSLLHYSFNGIEHLGPYVTANVNLWAIPGALIANPDMLSHLEDTERAWVMQAAAAAAERSPDLSDREADLVADLCHAGARFADASDADLAAMHQAFAPVFAALDQDPQTKQFIERIEELKEATDPRAALSVPAECTGPADTGETSDPAMTPPVDAPADTATLNGTYRWTITREDARADAASIDEVTAQSAAMPWIFTMTMADGNAELRHGAVMVWVSSPRYGEGDFVEPPLRYTVDENRIVFDWSSQGSTLEFRFTVDDNGTLHLRPAGSMHPGDAFVWTTKPWRKID